MPRMWMTMARFPLVLGIVVLMTQTEPTPEIPPLLAICSASQVSAALRETGEYTSSSIDSFVQIDEQQFMLNGEPYVVRGVNYYPSRYPWRRFLTEMPIIVLRHDLQMMRAAGFNTLRLFLWNEALFQCAGSGAVPNPDNMRRLDSIVRVAGEEGFRLIVTRVRHIMKRKHGFWSSVTAMRRRFSRGICGTRVTLIMGRIVQFRRGLPRSRFCVGSKGHRYRYAPSTRII
jgi:hypothetical protein